MATNRELNIEDLLNAALLARDVLRRFEEEGDPEDGEDAYELCTLAEAYIALLDLKREAGAPVEAERECSDCGNAFRASCCDEADASVNPLCEVPK